MSRMSQVAAQVREKVAIRRDPVAWARLQGVRIGARARLLGVGPGTFGSEPYLISLGDHVTVTSGVRFVTHDGGVWVLRDEFPDIDVFGVIQVGNNVFIGVGATILPGVTIGDNVVIGAGAVVNREVPPNSVAAGVPARVVTDLNTYREKSLAKCIRTKGMDRDAKRKAIDAAGLIPW